MSNKNQKPKRYAADLVRELSIKHGVTFKTISEEDAEKYFVERNNFLRTASYRKNYTKYEDGEAKEKYIDLDFSYLTELSTIDMYLRRIILKMCIDVEHALKVKFISDVEKDFREDGYHIVSSFLKKNPTVLANIEKKIDSTFTGDLIDKYFEICQVVSTEEPHRLIQKIKTIDCPVWVFVEIISFGDFLKLTSFYYGKGKFVYYDPPTI